MTGVDQRARLQESRDKLYAVLTDYVEGVEEPVAALKLAAVREISHAALTVGIELVLALYDVADSIEANG